MPQDGLEQAYQEAGPLVHTLALRALGSVEEAEDLVRRVFAAAAVDGASLDTRDLLHDAAERITGDLERRVRAKLATLDDSDVPLEPVTDVAAVIAEADRILLRAALDRLDDSERELLERALVHGDPRFELALMLGVPEEELERRLRDTLLSLWPGERRGGEHVSPEALASRALGIRVVDGGMAHIAQCRECKDAWRSLNDLVGSVTRMQSSGPVLTPRQGLWSELRSAIEAGEGVEPELDWREEARRAAERAQRRRTMILAAAVVLSSLFVGLTVVVAELLVEPSAGTRLSRAVLVDPRVDERAGVATVTAMDDGDVLTVEGPYAEGVFWSLEVWVVDPAGDRVSVGTLQTTRAQFEVPDGMGAGVGWTVEISREPWDGEAGPSGDLIATGTLG